MFDKSERRAAALRNGDVVAVYFKGGPECLWLDMYLDTKRGSMICISDIGNYAYHWGGKEDDFLGFCCKWLGNREWLLRKCIKKKDKEFDCERSAVQLRDDVEEWFEEVGYDSDALEEILDEASGFSENADLWLRAVDSMAERLDFELPDEWWSCARFRYSEWQERFAEICAESIVPELRKLMNEE